MGDPSDKIETIWFVLHGYAQLAENFIKEFGSIAGGTKLIVAPEALNKFYIKGTNGNIGATWMTKEDRENEITDYVNYLDDLYAEILKYFNEHQAKIIVLGFSQGAATAVRWAVKGASQLNKLIVWGSPLPHDMEFHSCRELLNALNLTLIVGDEDHYFTKELLEKEISRLNKSKIDHGVLVFKGKHEINTEALKKYFS